MGEQLEMEVTPEEEAALKESATPPTEPATTPASTPTSTETSEPNDPDPEPGTPQFRRAMQAKNSEIREMREMLKKQQDQMTRLMDLSRASTTPDSPNPPKFEDDPVEAIRHRFAETERRMSEMSQHLEAQRLSSYVQGCDMAGVQEFGKDVYDGAAKHLFDGLRKHYEAITGDPQMAEQATRNDLLKMAVMAAQKNRPFHRIVMDTAKSWGYRAPSTTPAGAQKQVDDMKRAQDAQRSLASVTGARAASDGSKDAADLAKAGYEDILDFSEKEFRKAMEELQNR